MNESEIEHRLTDTENRSKANQHRLDKVEKKQEELSELISAFNVLAEREQNVEKNVEEIKEDVKSLTNKPAKRWDSLVDKIILTVAAAVVGYFLSKFGL